MRPTFLVIGSQKAGSTSVHRALRQHPEVFVPGKKELNFFFLDAEYRKGLPWYERLFETDAPGIKARGEASPGYICHPETPRRIHDALPDVKLVLTVRNPIDRAYSQYWDNRRQLAEPFTWDEAVEPLLADHRFVPGDGRRGYLSRGVYMPHIERYLALFPREQLLVVVLDDLKADPHAEHRRIFEFVGVDPEIEVAGVQHNPAVTFNTPPARWLFAHPAATRHLPRNVRRLLLRGPKAPFRAPPMRAETRATLVEFYRPWNAQLEAFLGRPLGWDR